MRISEGGKATFENTASLAGAYDSVGCRAILYIS